jgi:hypothetical protein
MNEGSHEYSSVPGGRLSKTQPFDHLWIAAGVDDTGVFKEPVILVISLHVIERRPRTDPRRLSAICRTARTPRKPVSNFASMGMEICLKARDSCARTFNFHQMVELRDMPDAAGQIGFAIVSSSR